MFDYMIDTPDTIMIRHRESDGGGTVRCYRFRDEADRDAALERIEEYLSVAALPTVRPDDAADFQYEEESR